MLTAQMVTCLECIKNVSNIIKELLMQLETVSIDQLHAAEYNPRVELKPGDPAYESLKKSIQTYGYVEPIIVNRKTGNILAGHQRFGVLKDLGYTDVSIVFVDIPIGKEKALNIALNRIDGDWDNTKLAELLNELTDIPDFDCEAIGFDLPEVEGWLAEHLGTSLEDKEEVFDVEAELAKAGPVITKPGELFELGRHRLLCGDCTKVRQVRRLMNGERAILFSTDPPYLVNYDGTNHPGKTSQRRKQLKKNKDWSASYGVTWDEASANPDLFEKCCKVAISQAILPNAAWYWWHASKRASVVEKIWVKFGAFVHQQIIWVKDRPVLNRSWYTWAHEPCFFGWVRPNKPPRHSDRHPSTVWQIPSIRPGMRTDHPTSKPVELFAIPMRQHTRRGDICYEPFAGSGSQIIAAEKLGRRCIALEISPRYCDVIIRRWISFVGKNKAPKDLISRYCSDNGKEVQ